MKVSYTARVEPVKGVEARYDISLTPAQAKLIGALLANVICADLERLGFDSDTCCRALGYKVSGAPVLVNRRTVGSLKSGVGELDYSDDEGCPVAFGVLP